MISENRQAIVERVAREVKQVGISGQDVQIVLTAAGFFDLLEAGKEVCKNFISWTDAHEPDRKIYRFQYLTDTVRNLDAAINKAGAKR